MQQEEHNKQQELPTKELTALRNRLIIVLEKDHKYFKNFKMNSRTIELSNTILFAIEDIEKIAKIRSKLKEVIK